MCALPCLLADAQHYDALHARRHFRVTPLQVQLANDILDMALNANDPALMLTEADCVARLRVSRSPVRAALKHLVAQEALRVHPRGYGICSTAALHAARLALPRTGAEPLLRRLVDDYLDGVLRETMFENELIERYAATKGDVRAALQRLAEQGVVTRSRVERSKVVTAFGALLPR